MYGELFSENWVRLYIYEDSHADFIGLAVLKTVSISIISEIIILNH